MTTTVLDKLVTILGFEVDETGLRQAAKNLDEFGKSARKAGKNLTLKVTAPIVALGAAAFKAASDAEETQNRFNEVFKGIGKSATRTQKELQGAFGLSSLTTQELLSDVGDLLTGLGISGDEALGLAKDVVSLSGDVASFKNVQGGTERATKALTKALLGEREMLKDTFKTSVLEEEVKKRAIEIQKTRVDLTLQQAKAFATLEIVQERNTAAIGDYARTSEGAANQQRELGENLKELAVLFGQVILPTVTKAIKAINVWIKKLQELDPEQRELIVKIALVAAAIGPLLIILGALSSAVASIVGLFAAMGTVFSAVGGAAGIAGAALAVVKVAAFSLGVVIGTLIKIMSALWLLMVANPIGAIILGIVALGAAILTLTGQWDNFFNIFKKGFEFVKNGLGNLKDFVGGVFKREENAELTQNITGAVDRNTAGNSSIFLPQGVAGATNNTQSNSVKIENINVDASGSDSSEIAANIASNTRDQFQNTVQDFDSTIAR